MSEGEKTQEGKGKSRTKGPTVTYHSKRTSAECFSFIFSQLCFSYVYLPLDGQLKGTHVAAEHLFCLTVAPGSPHKGSLSGFTLLQSTYLDIFPSKYAPNG